MQSHEAYEAMPAKVSQQILLLLATNCESFKRAKAAYEEDPSKFTGRPRLTRYKHKTEGEKYPCVHYPGGEQARVGERTHSALTAFY